MSEDTSVRKDCNSPQQERTAESSSSSSSSTSAINPAEAEAGSNLELNKESEIQDYCDSVQKAVQWKLDKKIDFEHGGDPQHLNEIASTMDEWEGAVTTELGFTNADLAEIMRKALLQAWMEKNGDRATYRNLIGVFVKAGKTSYAKAVCDVLGSDPGHVQQQIQNVMMTTEDYCDRVPDAIKWKLDCMIDFEHEGVQEHLVKIASSMDEWEGAVATELELTKANIAAIKTKHRDDLSLQTIEALQQWQEKNGFDATYRNLIGIFIKAGKTSFAQAVCETLQGYDKMTKDVKKQYQLKKEAVKENEEKIKHSFATLVFQVCSTLAKQNLSMDAFHSYIAKLFVGIDIPQSQKVTQYFAFFAEKCLWSYSHYSPLENIAEEFAKTQTKPLLDVYKKQLHEFYSTTKLLDYIETSLCYGGEKADPKVPLETDEIYYQKLTVTFERRITNETLQYIDYLWRVFAEFFSFPSSTAHLDHVEAGSLQLVITWCIPDVFAMQIKSVSAQAEAESFYRTHQIMEVDIDNDKISTLSTEI